MEQFIKDILNYYNETPFKYTDNHNGQIIYGKCSVFTPWFITGEDVDGDDYEIDEPYENGKIELILRHPNDVSKSFKQRMNELTHKVKDANHDIIYIADTPMSLHYGLQSGVDMFNLIDAGWAINIEDLPKKIRDWAAWEQSKNKINKFI